MFTTAQQAITYSLQTSKKMLHRFVDDMKPEEFLHRPCLGANCAAWILGHLALTDRRQLTSLGVTDLPPIPDNFEKNFSPTRSAAGTSADFGDPLELVKHFDTHRDLLISKVQQTDAETLATAPFTNTPMFADKGEALLFMGLHVSMHMGQLSTIRRSLGRPPVT